jgi:hypothetical protein
MISMSRNYATSVETRVTRRVSFDKKNEKKLTGHIVMSLIIDTNWLGSRCGGRVFPLAT